MAFISPWNKIFDELLEFGIKLKTNEIFYVRSGLKQAYLKGKIDGMKTARKLTSYKIINHSEEGLEEMANH